MHDDDGTPRFRIDVGDPEVRFGAEYYGEEFHGEDAEESRRGPHRLAREAARMAHEVFAKDAVYGRELSARRSAACRLPARTRAELWRTRVVTYVDLAR